MSVPTGFQNGSDGEFGASADEDDRHGTSSPTTFSRVGNNFSSNVYSNNNNSYANVRNYSNNNGGTYNSKSDTQYLATAETYL